MGTTRRFLCNTLTALLLLLISSTAFAQSAQRGRLTLTVTDQTGGVLPRATATLIGLDTATKAATIPPVTANDKGVAVFTDLVVGRYSVRAEFSGFEMGLLRDFKINNGENKHVVVLALKNLAETVTVGSGEGQAAGSDRASRAFGLTVTEEQIQALSDDPAEMAAQIAAIGGSDAIIRVDSFEGQQLPPKSQIKSIHVTRDQFAAETEQPGSTFVDIITQPGAGPIRGGTNYSFRDSSLNAKSQFTPTKAPEQSQNFGFNVGGALVDQRAGFTLSVNGQHSFTTPNLTLRTNEGSNFSVLGQRQPFDNVNVNATVDYALTRDQTLKFAFQQNHGERKNLGIGNFNLPERAWSTFNNQYNFRVLEAGPIGRRTFINSRLSLGRMNFGNSSTLEAPTVIIQDVRVTGGAQRSGRVDGTNLNFASDIDHVRGIHSLRGGVQLYGDWYRATLNNNYLGTYYFKDEDAFNANTAFLYTRSLGDPLLSFFHARVGAYFQDDIRVRKGLTLSPGVRYSYQTKVSDLAAFEPRLGVTWSPFKNGATTLRLSGGIFHGWLDPGIWWQSVRSDSQHQRDIIISNPSYPDPGTASALPPANTYLLGNYKLNKNYRYSAGIDQRFSPRIGVNVLYNYYNQSQLPRGLQLNPLVNGVRVDPSLANVIQTVTDAELHRHELYVNFNMSFFAPSPAANSATFNWRRLAMNGGYTMIHARRNAIGPFDVPTSGSLDTEWGNGPADNPYRINVGITSTQIKNFSINVAVNAADGYVYMNTTGLDDNHDGLLNDRPANVGIWSLRGDPSWTVSSRIAYNLPMGTPAQGAQARYRTSLFISINNLTNHANLVGYSGVATSLNFMQATGVQNPRKIDMGLNMSF